MLEEKVIFQHRGKVIWVSCSPDGNLVASLGEDGCIMIYSFRDKGVAGFIRSQSRVPVFTSVSWVSRDRLAVGIRNKGIMLFDIEKRGVGVPEGILPHRTKINCLASWRKLLASGGEDKIIKLWDIAQRKAMSLLRGHTREILSVDWSPNGMYLASGGKDKRVNIWEVDNDKPLAELPKHRNIVVAVAFSNDGKFLASCDADGILKIWNSGTWGLHMKIILKSKPNAIGWVPDEEKIAIAFKDGRIGLLDLVTLKLKSFYAHKGNVTAITWCPHNNILLSGGEDGFVKLWSLNLGVLINSGN